MKKTKIVCTIGPASNNKEILTKLFEAGMNVARVNSSFASPEDIVSLAKLIRSVSPDIAIFMDTEGHKVRFNKFEKPIEVKINEILEIGINSSDSIYIDFPNISNYLHEGQKVIVDDGNLEFIVTKIENNKISLLPTQDGTLLPRKTVNLPGIHLDFPPITEKDAESVKAAVKADYDYIGVSFVRNVQDIQAVKDIIEERNIKIISKIENQEGVDNFDEILLNSDAIMVARGDLSVELPQEKVPFLQKEFIKKCNRAGKPVIVATQMLESMTKSKKPTRAEVNDIANAILDGTDAVMLSAESSTGNYPALAVKTMSEIAKEMEQHVEVINNFDFNPVGTIPETLAITHAVANICQKLPIKAVLVATATGTTARMLSRHRIPQPIYAFTKNEKYKNALCLKRGIKALTFDYKLPHAQLGIEDLVLEAKNNNLVFEDDLVVIVAGENILEQGATNMIEIQTIGKLLN